MCKKFKFIIFLLTLACGFSVAHSQRKVVESMEIPGTNSVYKMSYDAQGRLAGVVTYKNGVALMASQLSYPKPLEIVCVEGTFKLGTTTFEPMFSTDVTIYPPLNKFTADLKFLVSNRQESINVDKNGMTEGYSKVVSLKWSGNSISKMEWDGDEYKFKYSNYGYAIPDAEDWDWLTFAINKVVETDLFGYWFVGRTFHPFSKFPSEITINNDEKVVFDYVFMPGGNITIDYKWVKDGKSQGHNYIKVNFKTI